METGENRRTVFGAGGDDHALRGEAAQLTRLQVGDDDHLPPDELLGFIGERDSGNDGARFGFADIDFEVQQFVCAFHGFGGFDFTDPEINFREVIDGDEIRVSVGCAADGAGSEGLPTSAA